jgi:Major Facilitator Superfamily
MSPLNKKRSQPVASDRRWWALALLAMAEFVVVLDASIVNIALPSIGRGLHLSLANLSWVVNAYVLTFGGFLLLGGRLADLLGRRRIFTVGLAVFSLASLAGGLAQSSAWLIGARAIQGLGAALLAPAALSLVTATFREGSERNRALSVWGGGRGLACRRRRALRRRPHERSRLALGAVRERADRDRRDPADAVAHLREPRWARPPELRSHSKQDSPSPRRTRSRSHGLDHPYSRTPARSRGSLADRAAVRLQCCPSGLGSRRRRECRARLQGHRSGQDRARLRTHPRRYLIEGCQVVDPQDPLELEPHARVAPGSHDEAKRDQARLSARQAKPHRYAETRMSRPPPHVHGK